MVLLALITFAAVALNLVKCDILIPSTLSPAVAASRCLDTPPQRIWDCKGVIPSIYDRYSYQVRYFYNYSIGECQQYSYVRPTGSPRTCMTETGNDFGEEIVCRLSCQPLGIRVITTAPPSVVPVKPTTTTKQPIFSSEPICNSATYTEANNADCDSQKLSPYPMFQYSVGTGHCEPFSFTNCRPVRNMFPSMEVCRRTCENNNNLPHQPDAVMISQTCPPDQDPVECRTDPCSNAKCESTPTAECKPSFCGGCFARFFVHGQQVNCTAALNKLPVPTEMAPPPVRTLPSLPVRSNIVIADLLSQLPAPYPKSFDCPDNTELTLCDANPCLTEKCWWYTDAKCIPSYCGGCFAEFYASGVRLNCLRPPLPIYRQRQIGQQH